MLPFQPPTARLTIEMETPTYWHEPSPSKWATDSLDCTLSIEKTGRFGVFCTQVVGTLSQDPTRIPRHTIVHHETCQSTSCRVFNSLLTPLPTHIPCCRPYICCSCRFIPDPSSFFLSLRCLAFDLSTRLCDTLHRPSFFLHRQG